MATSCAQVTELGFVEKVDGWQLLSHYFPSKVGGKPAWLSLKCLPTVDELKCGLCKETCIFLVQVYANFDEKVDCFHRSIFIFICKNPRCLHTDPSQSIFAYRSQLPKINTFYSTEPPSEKGLADVYPKAKDYQKLCIVCGCVGTKACSRCQGVSYCFKGHQAADWKAYHKGECGQSNKAQRQPSALLFPEFELVTEPEEYKSESDEEKSEEQKQAEYRQFLQKNKDSEGGMAGVSETELDKAAAGLSDETFDAFQQRIKHEPQQVLRYSRGGSPLWVASLPHEPVIPRCPCGANRQFEFQIMPQLLSHLNVDCVGESIDWGTLVVYTCTDSCSTGEHYRQEYVLKQDFSNTDSVRGKTK